MATVVQETAPQPAPSQKAKGGAPAAKKKSKKSKKSQPGRYSQLVIDTIRRLGERGGSSLARVYTEARTVPWFDQQHGRAYLRYSIKALVQNDTLLQVKGTGANGSFRLQRGGPQGGPGRRGGAGPPAPKKSHGGGKKGHKEARTSHKAAKKSHKGAKPPSALQKKGRKPAGTTPKKTHRKGASLAAKKAKKAAKPRVGKA
ncbi:histone H1.01-like [Lissotriton helveticus]